MKFVDSHVNKEHRFSLGREVESGRCYLAVPVANRLADYEEYYELSPAAHDAYPSNLAEILELLEQCKAGTCDQLLFIRPGADRGIP
jgi:hypothetical protein